MEDIKTDHDLLIELRVVMGEVRRDIKELKDGTAGQLADHETRIRNIEEQKSKWLGKESLLGGAFGLAAGLVGTFLQNGKL